jgi:hypothetical protein
MTSDPPPRPSYRLALGLALVVAAIVLWPIYTRAWWENHDSISYPVRLIEYARSLRYGNPWPRWGPELYGGYGAPLFNFYPPGAVVPGAPFFLLGMSAYSAMKVAIFFYTAIGLFAAFLVAELVTARRDAAVLALVVFALAPYRATQLLLRGDLAEYSATALAMLALYCYLALRIRGPSLARALAAATSHAAIMLSHTITGQWSTELLGLFVLVWVVTDLRAGERRRALIYVVTFAGALGLMSIYVLPALAERGFVRIAEMATGHFATENNFLADLKWAMTPGFFFAGYPLIIGVPCALVAYAVAPLQRRAILLWGGSSIVLLALMCHFTQPLWRFLPFAKYIMFPWRLLCFLEITLTLLVAVLWPIAVARRSRATDAALAGVLLLLAGRCYLETEVPQETLAYLVPRSAAEVSHKIHSTVVFNEYLPLTVPKPPRSISNKPVQAVSPGVKIESVSRVGSGTHLVANADQPGYIDLEHYYFPGWQARVTASPAAVSVAANPEGLIRISLPTAGRYEIETHLGTTPVRATGTILTLLTMALLPLLLAWLIRRLAATHAA